MKTSIRGSRRGERDGLWEGGSGSSSRNDTTKQHSIFGREKAGIQGSSETGGGRRMLVVGGGKMEAEMRMNHALACAAHFLPGAAVVFIIFRPNPIHSGEGVIYGLPHGGPPWHKKGGDTPRSKNVNTLKASPTPSSSPPPPPFWGVQRWGS